MNDLHSEQIVYSEHGYDECFEYKNQNGRVPDGIAIGYEREVHYSQAHAKQKLILFNDIKYSEYDHQYWDNLELESDPNRLII